MLNKKIKKIFDKHFSCKWYDDFQYSDCSIEIETDILKMLYPLKKLKSCKHLWVFDKMIRKPGDWNVFIYHCEKCCKLTEAVEPN